MPSSNSRQLAFNALRNIYRRGAYADIALNRALRQTTVKPEDRGLVTELVYGTVRRQRSLDALIDQIGTKKARQQHPDLRVILHLGLYQLRYLTQIPAAAAVNTSVQLAKENGLKRLAGVANGLLRQYERLAAQGNDPLTLPQDSVERLGILHSFPDWIIENWLEQIGTEETEQLCQWFNQSPAVDLRVNPLKQTVDGVEAALAEAGLAVARVPHLPQALRLTGKNRSIEQLPGFKEGWWTVQDSSAQLVTHLLAPQPDEVVIDACAAPGGKTTHIAELMGDRGTIWAYDRAEARLARLRENAQRLGLHSITIRTGDSRCLSKFDQIAARVLVDAPCSGLGTLGKRPDIRWRQTPLKGEELARLQGELLEKAATWVKPGGILVYATCTLNPLENEAVIRSFLNRQPNWQIVPPSDPGAAFAEPSGLIKVWPHRYDMDGFFMVKLQKK